MLGLEDANSMDWEEFKELIHEEYCPRNELQKLEAELWNHKIVGSEIEKYTTRSHELGRLCPHMVTPAYKRIELYIKGLSPQIKEMVTSSKPTTIAKAIRLAHQLTDQAVAQGTLPKRGSTTKVDDHKRKHDNSTTSNDNNSPNTPQQQQQQQQQRRVKPAKNQFSPNQSNQSWKPYAGRIPNATTVTFTTNLDLAPLRDAHDATSWATYSKTVEST